jgi:hypothetical protein
MLSQLPCLPHLPDCGNMSDYIDRTYRPLLGRLGEAPSVWAELLFADPIGDVAVLGPPDGGEMPEQWESYEALIESLDALHIGVLSKDAPVWLMHLDGSWMKCQTRSSRGLWFSGAQKGLMGGMSGSPILSQEGQAVGVFATSGGASEELHTEGGPQARLTSHLPGRALQEMTRARKRRPTER